MGVNNRVVSAQGAEGYFEGDVPVQGAYLQALACYPLMGEDKDEDGVFDVGCAWDDDRDGVDEMHVVEAPLIVPLEAYGFLPGDRIMISSKTSIHDPNFITWGFVLYGLFSSSPDLITQKWIYTPSSGPQWPMVGPINRVPGAIDAALGGYVHVPQDNWYDARVPANDIPQDFMIGGYAMKNGGDWKGGDYWNPNMARVTAGFWITIPPGAKYLFVSMLGPWNLGDEGECKVYIDKDSDEDGLPNSWERGAIDFNKDGTDDLTLAGADWEHKDIYVEADFMQGHMPLQEAMNNVEDAFYRSPVTNPDNDLGIELHIETDYEDNIPHQDMLYGWGDFLSIKTEHFGTPTQRSDANQAIMLKAKAMAYHYCLFAHQYAQWNDSAADWQVTTSSGLGETPGNDFFVSLGAWTGGVGSAVEQAAAFMHELGHNLNLNHGGGDKINYKPNYLSIMNYLFEFPDTSHTRPLDYSRYDLPDLDELNLNETNGAVGGKYSVPGWSVTAGSFGPQNEPLVTQVQPIDWNWNNIYDNVTISANPNNFPQWDYTSPANETLTGYDDWKNVKLDFGQSTGYNYGSAPSNDDIEITWEMVQAMREEAAQRHEVAAISLSAPTGTVGQTGFTVNVTLANLGGNEETFNVTVFANATTIASGTLTLSSGNGTTISLPCTAAGLQMGKYALSAHVSPLVNESYTADNTIIGGIITVEGPPQPSQPGADYTLLIIAAMVIVALVAVVVYFMMRRKK